MSRSSRSMPRVSRVVTILLKHGFRAVIDQLGLRWHLPLFDRWTFGDGDMPSDIPVRLRKTMEDLGGAYVKLGQLLAMRPDLVPAEYCLEFQKLFDRAAPLPFEQVRTVIEAELGKPLSTAYSAFSRKPLGSASVAQVHYAKLRTGREVVVKVQRPRVRQQFEEDIEVLYYLAHKVAHRKRFRDFAPLSIVTEFDRYTKRELDFLIEAQAIDAFHSLFAHSKHILVPKVHWAQSTSRVLTMDYLPGEKLSDVLRSRGRRGIAHLADELADAMLVQVFERGVFHADLHPGNLILTPDNRLGLLDFGITGALDEPLRRTLLHLFSALVSHEPQMIVRSLIKLGTPSDDTDLSAFERETLRILAVWYSDPKRLRPTLMMQQLFTNCYKHGIVLPLDVILFGKALMTVESTTMQLNPSFNFLEFSKTRVAALARKKQSPTQLASAAMTRMRTVSSALVDLPQEAIDALERIKQGSVRVQLSDTDVRHLGLDIAFSSNRISLALLSAAFVVSGALLSDVGPSIVGYPVMSTLSLAVALFLFGMLAVSILREGSRDNDPHGEKYK